MNQYFMLGLTAGTFIIIEIYLIILFFKGILNSSNNSNNKFRGCMEKVSSYLLILLSSATFIGIYLGLMFISPTNDSPDTKGFYIYSASTIEKNITVTVIFLFEALVIYWFTKAFKINPSIFLKAMIYFVLTGLFLSYNIFLMFSDLSNTSGYSSLALGSVSIFLTLFIGFLTFKDDK
ncbi:hypothetical protein [Solibacillus sp. FSL K6-1523]|uniref:hypothetical protein n=1 Tax=Solibacillus sp. FSL K6-1523 TaxID=2921471 RepID=UPI0030F877B1